LGIPASLSDEMEKKRHNREGGGDEAGLGKMISRKSLSIFARNLAIMLIKMFPGKTYLQESLENPKKH